MHVGHDSPDRLEVVEEQVFVAKCAVVTDRVRVSTRTDIRDVVIDDVLQRGSLDIEHTSVDREVGEAPPPRQEADVLVISVVEERLVKRLFVVEEFRIRQTNIAEAVSLPTTLRSMRVFVEHYEESTTGGSL